MDFDILIIYRIKIWQCFIIRRNKTMFQLLLAIIYLAFISLGLPDSLLGAAWPSIDPELNVPISYAGWISMTIAAMTVVSSLLSDRVNRKLGTGKVTAISVATTAAALLGFSISHEYWMLLLWFLIFIYIFFLFILICY